MTDDTELFYVKRVYMINGKQRVQCLVVEAKSAYTRKYKVLPQYDIVDTGTHVKAEWFDGQSLVLLLKSGADFVYGKETK